MTQIIIYTKDNCAYCEFAKKFLKSKNLSFEEIRVDLHPDQLAEMEQRSQRRTVPQIFINNQSIGGYDDLMKLSNSNELQKLLNP
jgi:glutaredoxin 3